VFFFNGSYSSWMLSMLSIFQLVLICLICLSCYGLLSITFIQLQNGIHRATCFRLTLPSRPRSPSIISNITVFRRRLSAILLMCPNSVSSFWHKMYANSFPFYNMYTTLSAFSILSSATCTSTSFSSFFYAILFTFTLQVNIVIHI
jgi:hypothetical protein